MSDWIYSGENFFKNFANMNRGICCGDCGELSDYTVVAANNFYHYCVGCGSWTTPNEYMVPFDGVVLVLEES